MRFLQSNDYKEFQRNADEDTRDKTGANSSLNDEGMGINREAKYTVFVKIQNLLVNSKAGHISIVHS